MDGNKKGNVATRKTVRQEEERQQMYEHGIEYGTERYGGEPDRVSWVFSVAPTNPCDAYYSLGVIRGVEMRKRKADKIVAEIVGEVK